MQKHPTAWLLIILFLIACNDTPDKAPVASPGNDTLSRKHTVAEERPAITLGFFTSVPDTIDGCGSFFTSDTPDAANSRYIFLSNMDEFAIIKVDGKTVYLSRNTVESKELIPDSSYIEAYEGDGYKTILTVQKTGSYDEGGFYKGTLEVLRGKDRITLKVHGQMGC